MASTPLFENPSFALLHKLFKQFYLAITTFVAFIVQVTLLWHFFQNNEICEFILPCKFQTMR